MVKSTLKLEEKKEERVEKCTAEVVQKCGSTESVKRRSLRHGSMVSEASVAKCAAVCRERIPIGIGAKCSSAWCHTCQEPYGFPGTASVIAQLWLW